MREDIHFEAQVVQGYRRWIGVHVPTAVTERLVTRARVVVEGTLNGYGFRGSFLPTGEGHFMPLNKAHQRASGVKPGETVRVAVRRVEERPPPETPAELEMALKSEPDAGKWWDALSSAKHRIATTWISQAKSTEVRAYRVSDVLRRARRAYLGEGPFYPTREDQALLSRPMELQNRKRSS